MKKSEYVCILDSKNAMCISFKNLRFKKEVFFVFFFYLSIFLKSSTDNVKSNLKKISTQVINKRIKKTKKNHLSFLSRMLCNVARRGKKEK